MDNIYIPQWYIEQFLLYLRGHLLDGDMTHKQMVIAIDNYLKDIREAEVEDVK